VIGLLLSLEFKEIDNSIQLTKDYSSINNVVFRGISEYLLIFWLCQGDSQFDTNRDTQLNYDQTVLSYAYN